jgi:hypothetical protein
VPQLWNRECGILAGRIAVKVYAISDGRAIRFASERTVRKAWQRSERPVEDSVRLTEFFKGAMDRFGAQTPLSPQRMAEDYMCAISSVSRERH